VNDNLETLEPLTSHKSRGTKPPTDKPIYECDACGWFRCRVKLSVASTTEITHPEYGKKTLADIAVLDIARHDCDRHIRSMRHLQSLKQDANGPWKAHWLWSK
jgi:hypothetical protein